MRVLCNLFTELCKNVRPAPPRGKKLTPLPPRCPNHTPAEMPIDPRRLTPISRSRIHHNGVNAAIEINTSGGLVGYLLWLLRPATFWQRTYDDMVAVDCELIKQEITKAHNTTKKIGISLRLLSRDNLHPDHKKQITDVLGNDDELWHCFTTYLPFLDKHKIMEELEDYSERSGMREGQYLDLANMLRDTYEGVVSYRITEQTNDLSRLKVNCERYEEYLRALTMSVSMEST